MKRNFRRNRLCHYFNGQDFCGNKSKQRIGRKSKTKTKRAFWGGE